MRRRICGQENDGDGGAVAVKERKSEVQVKWLDNIRTTCRRENCQGMKHNAGLTGSVS